MPRKPYDKMTPEQRARHRASVRKAVRKATLRRVQFFASSPEALAAARAQMPPGVTLQDYLSQLIDLIAAGRLVPRLPDPK